ncbi:MAG: pinensin family lanthipeptide [Bacteroidota bacterium]
MKKRLKLNDVKVQSFVTSETEQIKGGILETAYSCLAYISCDVAGCLVTRYGDNCIGGGALNTVVCVAP